MYDVRVSEFLKAKFLDEMTGMKRLADSMAKFQSLLDACSEHLNGSKADFSLLTMTKASPVDMTLAPKSDAQSVEKTMKFISKAVEDINQGVEPQCPPSLLKFFQISTRFELAYGEVKAETSELFESNLKGMLKRKRKEWQTVKGTIEAINIHDKMEFTIYPRLTKPVRCQFEEVHFADVQRAIGKLTEVSGIAHLHKGEYHPVLLLVEKIRVIEQRPRQHKSLFGLGREAYAGVDPVAHVRAVRDDLEKSLGNG